MPWTEIDPESPEVSKDYSDVIAWVKSLGIRPRVFRDDQGVLRFRKNRIIDQYTSHHLNDIACTYGDDVIEAERAELYTLFGYSLSGFSEIFCEELDEFNAKGNPA